MEKTDISGENSKMKVYELALNIVPLLSEEALSAHFAKIKEDLAKFGAVMIAEQYPKVIDLAYVMDRVISNKNQKFSSAYFGWIKFEIDAPGLESFNAILKMDENVIRYLILKTVRESTLAPKKFEGKRRSSRSSDDQGETATEANSEAIDQKIEEMAA